MFVLPDYWWLLALAAVPQAAFVVVLAISRSSGTKTHCAADAPQRALPLWAVGLLVGGAAVGICYGIVQRDAVFILGQTCVLLIALIRNRLIQKQTNDKNIS